MTANGWKNKRGTAERSCKCGTWKQHWITYAEKSWPATCSVSGCSSAPTLGAHIINPSVTGERIAPFCDSCNKRNDAFDLKKDPILVSANTSQTCD